METAYEALYIIDTNLPDEQASGIIDKYSGVVARAGGTVDDVDRWEARRLAYEIKGRREGVYIAMNFRSEPPAKDELDRIFRISDDVLRHLITKVDENADRFPSQTRRAETDRREREAAARAAAAPPPPTPAEQATVTELSAAPPPVDAAARQEETTAAEADAAAPTATAAEPTPAVPDPSAATDAGLEPVPASAETAEGGAQPTEGGAQPAEGTEPEA